MGLHILITGNPIDGLFFYGPYKTSEDAVTAAERENIGADWWIAPLAHPDALV